MASGLKSAAHRACSLSGLVGNSVFGFVYTPQSECALWSRLCPWNYLLDLGGAGFELLSQAGVGPLREIKGAAFSTFQTLDSPHSRGASLNALSGWPNLGLPAPQPPARASWCCQAVRGALKGPFWCGTEAGLSWLVMGLTGGDCWYLLPFA